MDLLTGLEARQYNVVLETIYYLVYILGIPIVVIEALRKQRQRYELDKARVYTEVNDKYIDFLALAVQFPRLSITEHSDEKRSLNLSEDELVQQAILYDMLTSIFERTYLLYTRNEGMDSEEWKTWDRWLDSYVQKKSYVQYLKTYSLNGCFDLNFETYLRSKIER